MKIIHIDVINKKAVAWTRDGAIVCGNSDYKVAFTFDSEWDGINEKTARFVWGGQYYDVPFTGTECTAPIIMDADKVEVGIYAGALRTTTGAVVPCTRSILSGGTIARPEFGGNYTTEAKAAAQAAGAFAASAQSFAASAQTSQKKAEAAASQAGKAAALEERVSRNEKRLTNLEHGLTPDPFETVTDTAHETVVPAAALPFAAVGKVGGLTVKTDNGLSDTKVTALVSKGANLIPFPYRDTTKTVEGITFTVNGDGTITANGTAATGVAFSIYKGDSLLSSGSYTFSGMTINDGSASNTFIALQEVDENEAYLGGANLFNTTPKTISDVGAKKTHIYIYVTAGTTLSNVVFKPMLNRGTTAAPYKPYRTVDTFPIPIPEALVQFLEPRGYGRGVPGYPNYIDFEKKTFVPQTRRLVFNGTENWHLKATDQSGVYNIGINIGTTMPYKGGAYMSPLVSTEYDVLSANDAYLCNTGIAATDTDIFVHDKNYQDVTAWKAHLAELYAAGNPLVVEYATATPDNPVDLSPYLGDDNFIEVEGCGTIEAVNENENDHAAQIEITYQLKEVTA